MTCVSWADAQAYVSWLSRMAATAYRLSSEAEWGRAAAGSQPGCYVERTGNFGTCPVGSYGANGVGLSDGVGNLWEWTKDCWEGDCGRRVLRVGSWFNDAEHLRPGARVRFRAGYRGYAFGFRVARAGNGNQKRDPYGHVKRDPRGWRVSTSILLRRSEAGHGSPTAGNPPSPPPPIRTASRRFRPDAGAPWPPVRRRGRPSSSDSSRSTGYALAKYALENGSVATRYLTLHGTPAMSTHDSPKSTSIVVPGSTLRCTKASFLVLVSALLTPGVVGAQGILLLAHGGRDDWNRQVLELASQVDSTLPVEVAFGMANKRMIQDAVDRLAERDISGIVAVPLFISSHSSVMRATEYLLGSRDEAPPELQAFARMGARRDAGRAGSDPGFDRTTPVETTVPISMTTALDGHALVAEILISRAVDVSRPPEDEIVVLVAHGPSSAEDNDLWLDDMSILAKGMRPRTRFSRIEYLTVRDDAPDPARSQATAELRAVVEGAVREGKSALIVPLLLSYGGIEVGIRRRLEGLPYRMARQALLPDERLSQWVLMQAGAR